MAMWIFLPAKKPVIGERVQVFARAPCPCVNEHNELVAVRKGGSRQFGRSMHAAKFAKGSGSRLVNDGNSICTANRLAAIPHC